MIDVNNQPHLLLAGEEARLYHISPTTLKAWTTEFNVRTH